MSSYQLLYTYTPLPGATIKGIGSANTVTITGSASNNAVLVGTSSTGAHWNAISNFSTIGQTMLLYNQYNSSGSPDAGTAGYNTRLLNNEFTGYSWGTLSGNSFIINAGIYIVEAFAETDATPNHRLFIYNVGTSSYVCCGPVAPVGQTTAFLTTVLTAGTYNLVHYVDTDCNLGISDTFTGTSLNSIFASVSVRSET